MEALLVEDGQDWLASLRLGSSQCARNAIHMMLYERTVATNVAIRKRSLTLYASVMRAYVCVYAHTCVHICTHVHMRVYVHVCACTRMRSCICVRSVRTCAHVRYVRAQCARYMRVARFSSSFEQKFARFPRIENEFFVFSIHAPSEHGIAIRIVEVRSD